MRNSSTAPISPIAAACPDIGTTRGGCRVDVMHPRSQNPGTGPGGTYPTRSRPILTGLRILGMTVGPALRRCAKRERENDLLWVANHRHEPHLLAIIRHRDQLLPMSTPGHAKERPADLAEPLVTIPADRILAAAARRAKPSSVPGHARLLLTLEIRRELAEKLSSRAIDEGRNIDAILVALLETAALALVVRWQTALQKSVLRAMRSVKVPCRPRPALQSFRFHAYPLEARGQRGLLCGLESQGIFAHGSGKPRPRS